MSEPLDLDAIAKRAALARKECNVSIGLIKERVRPLCDDIDRLITALRAPSPVGTTPTHIAIWKDGTWKITDERSAEVFSHDADYLTSVDIDVLVGEKVSPVGTAPLREDPFLLEALEHVRHFKATETKNLPDVVGALSRFAINMMGWHERVIPLLPRSAPTLKGAPADEPR